jgi:hypothetical protein
MGSLGLTPAALGLRAPVDAVRPYARPGTALSSPRWGTSMAEVPCWWTWGYGVEAGWLALYRALSRGLKRFWGR